MGAGGMPETGATSGQSSKFRRKVTRRHDFGESHDINITPAIDLLVSLIPFLLISAVFMPIASIETFAPSRNSQTTKTEASLVMVVISSKGLTLTGSGPVMKNHKGSIDLPKGSGGLYAYGALTQKLIELKQNDPAAEDLLIMAEPNIEYSHIIDVMDAARTGVDGAPLFPQAFFGGVTS